MPAGKVIYYLDPSFCKPNPSCVWSEAINTSPTVYVCMVITFSKSKDQPGKVANPARGKLNREIHISLSPFAPDNLVSRDGFGSPVTR